MTTAAAIEANPADMEITAIVVNYCTSELTLKCVDALASERQWLPGLKVVVVDGNSPDKSSIKLSNALEADNFRDWVTFFPLSFNGGFGWANNQAMLRLLGNQNPPAFIYLVNPDALPETRALLRLSEVLLSDSSIAAAGSQLLGVEGNALGSAFRFPSISSEFFRGAGTPLLERLVGVPSAVIESNIQTEADWVTGASVLLRVAALKQTGLFDDGFFLYFEEVDLMRRMRDSGWKIVFVPASRVVHIGGASTGIADGTKAKAPLPDYWFRSRRRYFSRSYGIASSWFASLAWMIGYGIWQLRVALKLGRAHAHAPGELRSLLRSGIWPDRRDKCAGIARIGDAPGALPLWTK